MIKVEVNEAQLKALLNKTDRAQIQKGIDIALKRIGFSMEGTAKKLAPFKTGNLRRSITSEQNKTSVTTGTDVIYARIQEFGGATGHNKKVKIKGKPYLRPALAEQTNGKAIDILLEEINRTLK